METSNMILSSSSTKIEAIRRARLLKDFLNYQIFDLKNQGEFSVVFDNFQKSVLNTKSNQENSVLIREIESDLEFLKNLGEDFFKQFNVQNLNTLLEQIQKSIEQAKTIIVYIPFDIPESDLISLGNWFKKSLGVDALIEINFDPTLIGGCALSYHGLYKDFSIKQKIADNKTRIIASLTSFKNQVPNS